jgi:hypothetical protein
VNTIDDLRRTLESARERAPHPHGVLEAVQAKGKRIRRRRNAAAVLGVAALVAVATGLVVVPMSSSLAPAQPPPQPQPQPSPSVDPVRPVRLTVGWTGPGYRVERFGATATEQYLELRPQAAGNGPAILVRSDPGGLESGEAVDVPGKGSGFHLPLWQETGAAVGWRHPSGLWIIALVQMKPYPGVAEQLAAVIAGVSLTDAVRFKAPFRMGYLPPGLATALAVGVGDDPQGGLARLTGFNPGGTPPQTRTSVRENEGTRYRVLYTSATNLALKVGVIVRDEISDRYDAGAGTPQQSGGQEFWIFERNQQGGPIVPEGGTLIVVRTATCRASLTIADNRVIPREEQLKLVKAFEVLDCRTPAAWVPLPG